MADAAPAVPDPKAAAPAPSAPDPKPAPAPDAKAAPSAEAKGYWPEDWQSRLAGDDKDALKQIGRYASPEDIWKKARSLEKRMSSGELRAALPKDAKPEDIAAWRKDNGIPEAPDKYDLKGMEIPESDKAIVDAFLKNAHGANFTPDQAKVALGSYYAIAKSAEEAQAARDEEQRLAAIDTLAEEYGGKFSGYRNRVENFLTMFPESVRNDFMNARLPDGTAIFNNPDIFKTIVALSLRDIPEGVHVPAEGGDIGKTALTEYKEMQKSMRENRTAYNKDPGKQQRMADLIEYLHKHDLIDQNGNEILPQKKAA